MDPTVLLHSAMASTNVSLLAKLITNCTDPAGVLDTLKVLDAIQTSCAHALEQITAARVLSKILKTSGMRIDGPARDKLARACEAVKTETRFLNTTVQEHTSKVEKACDYTFRRVTKLARKKINKKKPRTTRGPPRAPEAKEVASGAPNNQTETEDMTGAARPSESSEQLADRPSMETEPVPTGEPEVSDAQQDQAQEQLQTQAVEGDEQEQAVLLTQDTSLPASVSYYQGDSDSDEDDDNDDNNKASGDSSGDSGDDSAGDSSDESE